MQNRFAQVYYIPTGDDVDDSLAWWCLWNEMATAHADITVRLEDLDRGAFENLLRHVGLDGAAARSRALHALSNVPTNANSARAMTEYRKKLKWNDLPDCRNKTRAEELAVKWGYDL